LLRLGASRAGAVLSGLKREVECYDGEALILSDDEPPLISTRHRQGTMNIFYGGFGLLSAHAAPNHATPSREVKGGDK